jgi:hypothetical protein
MAVALRPPVSAKGLTNEMIDGMAEEAANLEKGAFASDGQTYPDRGAANRVAAKYVRVIESRYSGVNLRSRTWETEPGKWVFGIRPKDVPTQETPPAEGAPPEPSESPSEGQTKGGQKGRK